MIEKIQLTALLFLALSWLFVAGTKVDNIPYWLAWTVAGTLFASAIVAVSTTLIIIWHSD